MAGAPALSVIAGAFRANLHGIAQLWQFGSLQMTVETDGIELLLLLLLRAALDAHLVPATARRATPTPR